MRLIAHRGFAARFPENTVGAARSAGEYADEVEIDVRRCDSGELVVIHDATVDRVTDGEGAVARHTLSELRDLSVLGTGEGVPTLRETLEAIPPAVGATLELKEVSLADDALRVAREVDAQVVVSSFHASELEGCRGVDPSVPRAYLFDTETQGALHMARELDCAYVHPSVEACTEKLVGEAHTTGMQVNAWTVETEAEARRLREAGVDGVIADCYEVRPGSDVDDPAAEH